MGAASSKRRKCTAEVFSSFSRGRSSSAMAKRAPEPATCTQQRASTRELRELLAAQLRARRTPAAASPSSCCHRESAGCRRPSSSSMPAGSNTLSARSISWIWYWMVRRSSKHQVMFGPTPKLPAALVLQNLRAELRCPCARTARGRRVARRSAFPPYDPSDSVGEPQQLQGMLPGALLRAVPCGTLSIWWPAIGQSLV